MIVNVLPLVISKGSCAHSIIDNYSDSFVILKTFRTVDREHSLDVSALRLVLFKDDHETAKNAHTKCQEW